MLRLRSATGDIQMKIESYTTIKGLKGRNLLTKGVALG